MGIPPTRNNDWNYAKWAKHAKYADQVALAPNQPHFYWQAGVDKEERKTQLSMFLCLLPHHVSHIWFNFSTIALPSAELPGTIATKEQIQDPQTANTTCQDHPILTNKLQPMDVSNHVHVLFWLGSHGFLRKWFGFESLRARGFIRPWLETSCSRVRIYYLSN